ncbi:secretory calcium-binding phosphoprotein 7 [Cynoglossus semilaevis]|uniref:secretory calcium-binding phosphoprotein 7 n=1 Tax=Cynoglossus semilaevis TaxID=244447 RepID=UPI0007DC8950|nr:protein app1-like [Cynoglossus semilaevis]
MKFLLLAACTIGLVVCAPHHIFQDETFMEFDIHYAPPEAAQVIPAGVPLRSLEVLLPVNAQRQPIVGQQIHGFIKHEIPNPNGRGTKDVYYPFGFHHAVDPAAVVPVVPVAPVAPVAPAAPYVPVAPVAPVQPVITVRASAPRPRGNDDDEEDDD